MLKFLNLSKHLFFASFLFFISNVVNAQSFSGRITDPDKNPLYNSTVELMSLPDSVFLKVVSADSNGFYSFATLPSGSYLVAVRNLQYAVVSFVLKLDSGMHATKNVVMTEKVNVFEAKGIIAKKDALKQKNDTVEYNAGNYKVNQDASAENLVSKMPGITNENGTIKAQGEEIKKVTVDGQDFFGEDAAAALKNLPAEVIDKVQVFDRQSDQSQFSGVDDGNSQKTLNIVTKAGKNNGQFGKIYAGYGTDERWAAGANINIFKGKSRLSLIGMSNNINQQNFSSQDILGLTGATQQSGGMRGPGGGGPRGPGGFGGSNNFTVSQQGGINTTHALGMNYSLAGGKKYKLTASYFFNQSSNITASFLNRTYFLSALSNQFYLQGDTGESANANHRLNARLEYNIDSNNSIIFTPQFSVQNNSSNSLFLGATNSQSLESINRSSSSTESESKGYTFSQSLLLRHKFKKPGNTISLNLSTSNSSNTGNTLLKSGNTYYQPSFSSDVFEQNTDKDNNSFNFNPNLSYTQAVSKRSIFELTYNPTFNFNKSYRYTARLDSASNAYTITDSLLSNDFNNYSYTQRGGLTYRYNHNKLGFNLGANVQSVDLNGEQSFPKEQNVQKTFVNVLPNAMLTYAKSKSSNLRIHYRTSTELPSISQLQNVVNNSNPLILSSGNADLKQEFRHNVFMRYSVSNAAKGKTFFVFARFNTTLDFIGNSTILAANDTVINGNIELKRGAQISRPVNLKGYRTFSTFVTYGLPLKFIKSTLNLNLGQTITRSPAMINGQTNYSSTYNTNGGVVLASNISESIDFTLNYNTTYTSVVNTLQSNLNNQYLIQNFNARINYLPTQRIVLNTDITNSSYTGLGAAFNQSIWLFNAGAGYKFLKDRRGELKLSVFDAFKQNTSISRTVTESYIEDKNTRILTRFYMLTFTYSIRHFKAKPKASK